MTDKSHKIAVTHPDQDQDPVVAVLVTMPYTAQRVRHPLSHPEAPLQILKPVRREQGVWKRLMHVPWSEVLLHRVMHPESKIEVVRA